LPSVPTSRTGFKRGYKVVKVVKVVKVAILRDINREVISSVIYITKNKDC